MLFKKRSKKSSVGDDKKEILPAELPPNESDSLQIPSTIDGKLKQKENSQAFSDKETTLGLGTSTEKETLTDTLTDEPDSESGTMTTLPPYSRGEASLSTRSDSKRKSADFTSQSSDIGPDINPVTSQLASIDDGKEVYIPDSRSPSSPSIPLTSTHSSHRTSVVPSFSPTKSYREYPFYYTNAMTHLILCDPDHQALYFAEVSPFAKSMPDVCIRDILAGGFDDLALKGPNLGLKEAQAAGIVGVADSMPNSRHIKIGLGDPLQPESQKWILMKNVHEDLKAGSEKYDMVVTQPGAEDRSFIWIRGTGGSEDAADIPAHSKDAKEQYRMLSSDGVVAVFRNAGLASFKKRGTLRMYDTTGMEDLSLLIFTSIAALCERQRRRKVKKGLMLKF